MRDASAFLGAWPFAGVPPSTLASLTAEYQAAGIDGAALSPVEAVLQPEPMAANRRLFAELSAASPPFFALAVPILNPSLPGWEEHLATCQRSGGERVRAIKVVPGYHDYALDHPALEALAGACAEQRIGLCLQVRMEDERMHHPRMGMPPVKPAAVVALATRWPRLPLLVCGGTMAELAAYRDCPNVRAELSFVESGHLLRDALGRLGPDRLLVGSHAPIHMVAPNVAKPDADELDAATRARLTRRNFDRFFGVA